MKKKILKRSMIGIVSAILLTEIILRVFYYEEFKSRVEPGNFTPDSLFNKLYVPNSEGHIVTPGVDHAFKINNLGFFGPDFEKEKKDSVFRIVVVGNSNSSGMHINGENTFTKVLQNIFKVNGLNKFEVINCAVNGALKDIQNINLITHKIVTYSPDLILFETDIPLLRKNYVVESYDGYVIEYKPNDPVTRKICIDRINRIKNAWYITMFYDASYIVRALCKSYLNGTHWNKNKIFEKNNLIEVYLFSYVTKISSVPTEFYFYAHAKSIEIIIGLKDSLKKINCELVLFNELKYSENMQKTFKKNDIKYIEPHMEMYEYLPVNSQLEGHFNELAHALWAERIFDELTMKKYIPIQ